MTPRLIWMGSIWVDQSFIIHCDSAEGFPRVLRVTSCVLVILWPSTNENQDPRVLCLASGSHVWVLFWKGILESGRDEGARRMREMKLRQNSDQSSILLIHAPSYEGGEGARFLPNHLGVRLQVGSGTARRQAVGVAG